MDELHGLTHHIALLICYSIGIAVVIVSLLIGVSFFGWRKFVDWVMGYGP